MALNGPFSLPEGGAGGRGGACRHIVRFSNKHRDFWLAELSALLRLAGHGDDHSGIFDPTAMADSSTLLPVSFPETGRHDGSGGADGLAKVLCQRAVLINRVYEHWASAETYDELVALVGALGPEVAGAFCAPSCSWSLQVDAFGRKLTMGEQHERRELFRGALKFKGPVSIDAPDHRFWIFEDYSDSYSAAAAGAAQSLSSSSSNGDQAPAQQAPPRRIYFFREVCRGQGSRIASQYSLKKRIYLGPTSMDTELSFVMANQGLVRKGSIVMDPFVGTGSLLVAAAAMGASMTLGTDIDVRVLKGMNRIAAQTNSDVFSNFTQYGLAPPCILRADNSRRGCVLRDESAPFLDAIVCDPPYGVRAGARRCGSGRATKTGEAVRAVPQEYANKHVPMTQKYETEDVMLDLLDMAARRLVMGGRLVYLLPCLVDFRPEEELPSHPCLRVVANSEQRLSQFWSRRLITMEKVHPYDGTHVDYNSYLLEARRKITAAAARHREASVAYTDLHNKLKRMAQDARKVKSSSNRKRARMTQLFVAPTELVKGDSEDSAKKDGGAGIGGRAYGYSYDWWVDKSLREPSFECCVPVTQFLNSAGADGHKVEHSAVTLKGCELIRPSGKVQLCAKANAPGFEQEGDLKALRVPTHRGSLWGSRGPQGNATHGSNPKKSRVETSSSAPSSHDGAPASRQAKSLQPYDQLLSNKSLGEILYPVMRGDADWFGVEALIWYKPLAHRDEAGLYLYQDDMNYIKIIVEGARRHYKKPEVSVGVQVNGLPQSSPTYFSGRGTRPSEHPFRVRLECCPARRKCAGLVWSDLDNMWHVVAVIDLDGADSGSDKARVLKSDMDFKKLRPMLMTNTTKIHKDTGDGKAALYAEFAQFRAFGGSSASREDEDHEAMGSTRLRIR